MKSSSLFHNDADYLSKKIKLHLHYSKLTMYLPEVNGLILLKQEISLVSSKQQ